MKSLIAKLFGIKTCDAVNCSYNAETNEYTINGKKYGGEFFDILANEFDGEHVFRVVTRGDVVFTIVKLPLQ